MKSLYCTILVSLWSLYKVDLSLYLLWKSAYCWAKGSHEHKVDNSYRKLSSVISVDTIPFIKLILGLHEQNVLGLVNLLKHGGDSTKISLISDIIDHPWYVFAPNSQQGSEEIVFLISTLPPLALPSVICKQYCCLFQMVIQKVLEMLFSEIREQEIRHIWCYLRSQILHCYIVLPYRYSNA